MHACFVSMVTIPCLPPRGQLIANTLHFKLISGFSTGVIFKKEKNKNLENIAQFNKVAHTFKVPNWHRQNL